MSYQVDLDAHPGREQHEEVLTVRWDDGREESMRLHEYERVYAVPGLYEEVVQERLECASPGVLADAVIAEAGAAGVGAAELRAFDLGAGNGVVGEELAARGIRVVAGADNIDAARAAAERDRPGLYTEYLTDALEDWARTERLIADHGLNLLTAAGALGRGHIPQPAFARLWDLFPSGSWLAVTVHEELARPGDEDIGDWLAAMQAGDGATEIVHREAFRHRLTMAGDPITYLVIVGRRR
jgi:hypothetical protein